MLGLFNGWAITLVEISCRSSPPWSMFMVARGLALIMPKILGVYLPAIFKWMPIEFWNANVADYSIGIDRTRSFEDIVGNFLGFPIPIILMISLYIVGAIILQYTRLGRVTLAIGINR